MTTVVLPVAYASVGSNIQCLHRMFWNTTVWIHVESKDDSVHGPTSIGVVGLGVGFRFQALSLTNLADHLVKQLRG